MLLLVLPNFFSHRIIPWLLILMIRVLALYLSLVLDVSVVDCWIFSLIVEVLSSSTRKLTLIVLRLFFFVFHCIFLNILGNFIALDLFSLFIAVSEGRLVSLSFPLLYYGENLFIKLLSVLLFRDILIVGKARGFVLAIEHFLLQVDSLQIDWQLIHLFPAK